MAKPIETEYGGLVGKPKKKGGRRGGAAPVAPSGPRPVPAAPPRGSTSSGSSRSSSSTSSGRSTSSTSSSRSSGGGGASGYEKRAIARENQAKSDAADRYVRQAKTLEAQASALQRALRKSFDARRDQQLGDITEQMRQQKGLLREGFRKRYRSLKGASEDNEKAEAGQSSINAANVLRERGDAMAEIAALGAGGSDSLQAQLMSLRNWQANQTEVNRGYYDTLRSINSSLTDLEVDTKTALANAEIEANADKEQVWTDFYNQVSETQTQLGNVRGQQADLYNQAAEMGRKAALGGGKKKGGNDKKGDQKKGDKPLGGKKDGKGGAPTPAERNDRTRPGSNADRQPGNARAAGNDQKQGGKKNPLLTAKDRRQALRTAVRREVVENRFNKPYGKLGEKQQEQVDRRTRRQVKRIGGPSGVKENANDDVQKRYRNITRRMRTQEQNRRDRRFINRTADNAAEANRQSRKAFNDAARTAGKSWNNPGVSDSVMDWEGRPDFEAAPTGLSKIQAARTVSLGQRPEGASLRKWA